eukprot:COSAG03_NODE_22199_length_294_cov_0.784615_1_plen_97_part_11
MVVYLTVVIPPPTTAPQQPEADGTHAEKGPAAQQELAKAVGAFKRAHPELGVKKLSAAFKQAHPEMGGGIGAKEIRAALGEGINSAPLEFHGRGGQA